MSISASLDVSIASKSENSLTSNVNWYLERILPCFESSKTTVENFFSRRHDV